MINSVKNTIRLNLKNIVGWKTDRKILVISVDDYGNVRLDSKKARSNMDREGMKAISRFDKYDTLENREDLEMLFEALSSVKDKQGNHAVFTPFAMPCNLNYEKIAETGFQAYHSELLPETYSKLTELQPEAYKGAWALWNEGIDHGLLKPQFHGKEHLNLKVLKEKLAVQDPVVITALKNRSYTSVSNTGYDTISAMAAFDFWEYSENKSFPDIIREGLKAFETVYGYPATHFNPPGGREHPYIHEELKKQGIEYIDVPWIKKEHQGRGKYKTKLNYTGKKNNQGQTYMVRNVVFEPSDDRGVDWVTYSLKQIEAAFSWNRPAVISSHRVNFCGHIDPENRNKGIEALKLLLKQIEKKWPEVEFMGSAKAMDELKKENIKQ